MILIPDIKFPSNCEECPCSNDGVCKAKSINRGEDNYLDYSLMCKQRMEWCPLLRVKGGHKVNAKQSLKAASKRIEELEDWNNKAKHEITAFNACIDSVIAGKRSFCDWCEEKRLGECEKEQGPCEEWWLADVVKLTGPIKIMAEGEDADEGKGLLQASIQGREGT